MCVNQMHAFNKNEKSSEKRKQEKIRHINFQLNSFHFVSMPHADRIECDGISFRFDLIYTVLTLRVVPLCAYIYIYIYLLVAHWPIYLCVRSIIHVRHVDLSLYSIHNNLSNSILLFSFGSLFRYFHMNLYLSKLISGRLVCSPMCCSAASARSVVKQSRKHF